MSVIKIEAGKGVFFLRVSIKLHVNMCTLKHDIEEV